jgi:hypothetical protein
MVGLHHPFLFTADLPFLNGTPPPVTKVLTSDALITSYTRLPGPKSHRGSIYFGTSKGNIYNLDLDASISESTLIIPDSYKTNPVSQALHLSRRETGNVLFVGGEMCDTVIFLMPDDGSELVHLHSVPNWAPVADCQVLGDLLGGEVDEDVVNRSVDELVAAFPSEGRDRLYVGSGHRGEGAIRELRSGLKTNVLVEFELEQYPPSPRFPPVSFFVGQKVDCSVQKIWNLTDKGDGEDALEGYLVLSMTHNETKVLRWSSSTPKINGVPWTGVLDMAIDDCTAQLSPSYHFSESTLAVSLTDNGLLQVTSSGIYLGDVLTFNVNPDERLVQAAIVGEFIAIVVYSQSQSHWSLITYHLTETSLHPSDQLILPREPTAIMSSFTSPTTHHTFLSYRQPPEIQIYSSALQSAPQLTTLPIDSPDTEIHSIELLFCRPDMGHLLIGTRHGLVLAFRLVIRSGRFDFPEHSVMSLGNAPVEFIPQVGGTGLFAMSGFLWEIEVEQEWLEGLKVREVLFDDFRVVIPPFAA